MTPVVSRSCRWGMLLAWLFLRAAPAPLPLGFPQPGKLFCSPAETEPVAPSAVQSWHISAGRERNQTTPMWAHLHSCGYPRLPLPRFQPGFILSNHFISHCVVYFVLEQFPLQKWADTTSAITCSPDLHLPPPCELCSSLWPGGQCREMGFGSCHSNPLLPNLPTASHLHWTPRLKALVNDSNLAQFQVLTVHVRLETAEISWAQECHKKKNIFSCISTWNPPGFTLTMCSLGSRLQSAKVISLPSRNLRVETVTSSRLFSSISSGRGEFRYSSSFCRVFKRPRSKAAQEGTILTQIKNWHWYQNWNTNPTSLCYPETLKDL